MLLMDWLSTWVTRPRMQRPDVSATSLVRPSGAHESGRPAAYPSRKPGLGSLPGLIHRYAVPLERARRPTTGRPRVWSDIRVDIHRTLTEYTPCVTLSQGIEAIHTPSGPQAQWSGDIDQAAFVLTAGAWAVGQDYRVTHPTEAQRWRLSAEGLDGSIPAEARKAIEPAIRFAYWVYGILRETDPASSAGTFDRADHEARARVMYRALASSAYACCRAGLAFDDLRLDGKAESGVQTIDPADRLDPAESRLMLVG